MSSDGTALGGGSKEADLRQLGQALGTGQNARTMGPGGTTSDLSLDEILLMHSVGLEPAQVVFGIGCISVISGAWVWGTGPVTDAHEAFHRALSEAKESMRSGAHAAGAVGVLGVDVEIECSYHRFTVILTGTAVRSFTDSTGQEAFPVHYRTPFLCDLSARDFAVLSSAGWYPLDLVAGASYVHAPRRAVGAAIGQSMQNVELANFTQSLYQAREAAMEELQSHITQAGGSGLVDVKVVDRPVHFARHVVEFVAYGTAVKMLAKQHTHPQPTMVLPLDDKVRTFEATSLD
ncbi:MAG: heavy metal-binding domain-containing protein [Acidimicrobiales bacterium]